jgi:hypothetical protein
MELNIVNDKISPFPTCTPENFTLQSYWFLPQDLSALRKFTKNDRLAWDFSSIVDPNEQMIYRRIYRDEWTGDLGLLFYRKILGYWVGWLPKFWLTSRVHNQITPEEYQQWGAMLLERWKLQEEIYLKQIEIRKTQLRRKKRFKVDLTDLSSLADMMAQTEVMPEKLEQLNQILRSSIE